MQLAAHICRPVTREGISALIGQQVRNLPSQVCSCALAPTMTVPITKKDKSLHGYPRLDCNLLKGRWAQCSTACSSAGEAPLTLILFSGNTWRDITSLASPDNWMRYSFGLNTEATCYRQALTPEQCQHTQAWTLAVITIEWTHFFQLYGKCTIIFTISAAVLCWWCHLVPQY